jgi:WD40 repeat protein
MRLITLGGLELAGSDFQRPKPLLLLAYLILEGSQDRRHLAELFWPGAENALGSLATTLTRLRQGTDGKVMADEHRAWAEVPCDADELLRLLEEECLEEAVDLYRGRFLDGFHLKDLGVELEEWIYRRREQLAARVRGALLSLGEEAAAGGDFTVAAKQAEAAYLLPGAPEPEAEDFVRLFRLLQAGDNPHAAEVKKEAESFGLALSLGRDASRAELSGTKGERQLPEKDPYKGLASFQEEDAGLFFGRETVTDDLVQTVKRQPCTVVVGVSGSGKSSLVFAGLVPALRSEEIWLIADLRPGREPFRALASALITVLEPELSKTDQLTEGRKLTERLRAGSLSLADVIGRIVQEHSGRRFLLVIDQLEELYSLGRLESSSVMPEAVLNQLVGALRSPEEAVRLVVTVRADFLAPLLAYGPMVDVLRQSQFLLGSMTGEELRDAIEKPAELYGVAFEDGLTDRILSEVEDREGSLPLLEFTLSQLWERRQGRKLSHQVYDAIGGVEQALANHAEKTLLGLSEADRAAAQKVFLQLVQPGEGQEDSRRVTTRGEVGERHWQLVSYLAGARLVVTGQDEGGEQVAEVIHEALIRRWRTLRGWLDEHRAFRIWQERLRQEVKLWQASAKDEGALLHGFHLEEARQNLEEYQEQLSTDELDFIESSLALEERLQAEERQRQEEREQVRREQDRLQRLNLQRLRGFLAVMVVLSFLAGWQWWVAGRERDRAFKAEADALAAQELAEVQRDLATRQGELALMRQLGAEALVATQLPGPNTGYFDRAVLLAAHAVRLQENTESTGNLLRVLQNKPPVTVLRGHGNSVEDIAFSFDGRRLMSGSRDRTIKVWDVASGTLLGAPLELGEIVFDFAVSPDDRLLAIATVDNYVLLWDLADRKVVKRVRLGADAYALEEFIKTRNRSVVFHPDGSILAIRSTNSTIVLLNVDTGEVIGEILGGHDGGVVDIAFSPDGRFLASGGTDGKVLLWDVFDHKLLAEFPDRHRAAVLSVAFSPDGRLLATGSWDQTVILWDVVNLRPLSKPLMGHRARVWSVAFSPDGRVLASGGDNGYALLWDVAGQRLLNRVGKGEQAIFAVSFSSDGRTIAVADSSPDIKLWEVRSLLSETLTGHGNWVWAVAYSPDGRILASGGEDGTVLLWDVASGAQLGQLFQGRSRAPLSLAFSPDGEVLAVGRRDDTIALWDVTRREPLGEPLTGHERDVLSVDFSPDGQVLASGGADGTIRLWDTQNASSLGAPLQSGDQVRSVAFRPDGAVLVSGDDRGMISLWDVAGRAPLGEPLQAHDVAVGSVAFSPDGAVLASGGWDQTVRLWDVASRAPLGEALQGHAGRVWSVAFDPEGRYLASASEDNTVILWDVAGGTLLGDPLKGHDDWVLSAAFSPDGNSLATSSRDRSVRLWDVNPHSWLEKGCSYAGRNLTQREWQRYLGERPYRRTCLNYPDGL